MNVWRAGARVGKEPPHSPPGFGLLMFGDQASSSVLVACLDTKTLLVQGLNFWKPIKMCLLWVGSKPLDVDLSPNWCPPFLLLSTWGWTSWEPGSGRGG